METKLFNYLEKVRALLAKAERTDNPDEKAAYSAKAQQIMQKYRIEEEELIASGDPTAATPLRLIVDLCSALSPFAKWYGTIAYEIAEHVGARIAIHHTGGTRQAAFVGYESDVRVAVALLTAAQLVFSERLEPQIDPSLSEEENIYRLRQSGITRAEVARRLWGPERGATAAAHAKVGRVYKEQCSARGETVALDGKGIDLDTFRQAYAREFYWRLTQRLEASRSAVDAEGGVLLLHGRKERVEEAYYGFYPHLRPAERTEVATTQDAPSKPRRQTKADALRLHRKYASAAARAGGAAGGSAAEEVQIDRVSARKVRLEESPEERLAIDV